MDPTKSLVFNFQNASLIEHPIIVITHRNHSEYFHQGMLLLLEMLQIFKKLIINLPQK